MTKTLNVLEGLLELDRLGAEYLFADPDRYNIIILPCVCPNQRCRGKRRLHRNRQRVARICLDLKPQLYPLLRKFPREMREGVKQ